MQMRNVMAREGGRERRSMRKVECTVYDALYFRGNTNVLVY